MPETHYCCANRHFTGRVGARTLATGTGSRGRRGGRRRLLGGFEGGGAAMDDRVIDRGQRVEVRSRFVGRWTAGFETSERTERDGDVVYRLRRLSDGVVLPALFPADDVRLLER